MYLEMRNKSVEHQREMYDHRGSVSGPTPRARGSSDRNGATSRGQASSHSNAFPHQHFRDAFSVFHDVFGRDFYGNDFFENFDGKYCRSHWAVANRRRM